MSLSSRWTPAPTSCRAWHTPTAPQPEGWFPHHASSEAAPWSGMPFSTLPTRRAPMLLLGVGMGPFSLKIFQTCPLTECRYFFTPPPSPDATRTSVVVQTSFSAGL